MTIKVGANETARITTAIGEATRSLAALDCDASELVEFAEVLRYAWGNGVSFDVGIALLSEIDPRWVPVMWRLPEESPSYEVALRVLSEVSNTLALAISASEPKAALADEEIEDIIRLSVARMAYGEMLIEGVETPGIPHVRVVPKVGRNSSCPCGSGKKFKKCCASAI